MILHEFIQFDTLRIIWWPLLGVLLIGFALTDGLTSVAMVLMHGAAWVAVKAGRELSTLLASKVSIVGMISSVGLTMFPFILMSDCRGMLPEHRTTSSVMIEYLIVIKRPNQPWRLTPTPR